MPEMYGPVAWTITSQQKTREPSPGGQVIEGVRITYRAEPGITGSIFVPLASYKPDIVKKMLQDEVANHQAIAKLTG